MESPPPPPHHHLSSHSYYCSIYHIIKPNTFRDVKNLNHDKTIMNMTLNEFNLLIDVFSDEKYRPLTNDTPKDKVTEIYPLRLFSFFVVGSSPF